MATGDSDDMLRRILSNIPKSWATRRVNLSAILGGPAAAFAWIFDQLQYVRNQARRISLSDAFLDLAFFDFLGLRIKRRPGQSDAAARDYLKQEVLRGRNTRENVRNAVADLTGTKVTIFEAFNAQDTGGWGAAFAFNAAGAWGSALYPRTMFIKVVRPGGAGIPNLSGFNNPQSGFSPLSHLPIPLQRIIPFGGVMIPIAAPAGFGYAGSQFAFADSSLIKGPVTDQDIYDTINFNRAAGVTCWVKIVPPPIVGGRLDIDFQLDVTPLM